MLLLRVYNSWHSRSPPRAEHGAVHSFAPVTVQTLRTLCLFKETGSVGHVQGSNRTKGHSSVPCAMSEEITLPRESGPDTVCVVIRDLLTACSCTLCVKGKGWIKYFTLTWLLWALVSGHAWMLTQGTRRRWIRSKASKFLFQKVHYTLYNRSYAANLYNHQKLFLQPVFLRAS